MIKCFLTMIIVFKESLQLVPANTPEDDRKKRKEGGESNVDGDRGHTDHRSHCYPFLDDTWKN